MKAVILAGGFGTRLSEETEIRPKPMIEIGGRPLIWHIMKILSKHGIRHFIICLGYKGQYIKEYFLDYRNIGSDLRVNLLTGKVEHLDTNVEDWVVELVDTGLNTMTGGRLKRVGHLLDEATFLMTYGDGVADIDISAEIRHHQQQGRLATVAGVRPPGRFGVLKTDDADRVLRFEEKPSDEVGWINGGFFVLERGGLDYIDDDNCSWEREPLSRLALDNQLTVFRHEGFWKPCDTLRDKRELEALWDGGAPPWRIWE